MVMWQIPWQEGPDHSWEGRLMLVAFSAYKWVLTVVFTASEMGFAPLVLDTSAQNTIQEQEL